MSCKEISTTLSSWKFCVAVIVALLPSNPTMMAGVDVMKRMPKFKRCKITQHQLHVLMHNFGARAAETQGPCKSS